MENTPFAYHEKQIFEPFLVLGTRSARSINILELVRKIPNEAA